MTSRLHGVDATAALRTLRDAVHAALPAVVVGIVAMPALLVLWATTRGPGLSPDSVYYASAARSWAAGDGLVQYDGQPLTWFPPGLSMLLGAGEAAGVDLLTSAVLLNVAAAAGVVWLSYRIARDLLESQAWALAAALLVGTSSALFGVHVMLWTEPLFMCCALLTLRLLQLGIRERRFPAGRLLALVLVVGAACSLRYVGIVLVPLVALGVFLAWHDTPGPTPRGPAALRALVVAALAALPALGIMLRNVALGAAPMGERARPDTDLVEVLDRTLQTFGSFVDPRGGVTSGATPLGVLLAALMVTVFLMTLLRWGPQHWLLCAYLVSYVAAIWWAALTTQLDAIDQRLLAPALPLLVILGLAVVRHGLQLPEMHSLSGRQQSSIRMALGVLLLGISAVNLADVLPRASGLAQTGIGYNHESSLASPLANAVRRLPPGGVAASDPWLAYWVSGRTPVLQVPRTGDHYWSQERTAVETQRLLEAVRSGRVRHLALWDYTVTALTPGQLASSGLRLTEVGRFVDGRLYSISTDPR